MNGTALYRSPGRDPIPVTPPRLDTRRIGPPQSPTTATPTMTPKAGDLRSVASMPSLQSFNSVHSFQSNADLQDFDVLDFAQFGNDGVYYDMDPLQTPDLDPLSPAFYEMQGQTSPQHPLLTPELSGSVGSGTSLSGGSQIGSSSSISAPSGLQNPLHANLIATNIEGLGIAEPVPHASPVSSKMQQSQWPPIPSPDGSSRRNKIVGPPRVTKKPSKQTLKQRRSRSSLNSESNASAGSSHTAKRSTSPATSPSTVSSKSSMISIPATAAASNQHQHSQQQLTSNPAGGHRPSTQLVSSSQAHPSATTSPVRERTKNQPMRSNINPAYSRMTPATPFHASNDQPRVRGKANASPAMQSPLRPGQQPRLVAGQQRHPRLPAAAAATALFMPQQPRPDSTRKNSMAAAAAAAAASASHQSPITPMAERQVSRVSPSTILLSNKAGGHNDGSETSTIKANHAGSHMGQAAAPSPTPAARMHSSSKLVASASDSSPAKGVWQQAPRGPIPLPQLPKPVLSPRKSASTSNIRRDARRKQNKVIPEMSSSLNQFQVDLKPKQRTSKTSMSSSSASTTPVQMQSQFDTNHLMSQYQLQGRQSQFGLPSYDVNQQVIPNIPSMQHTQLGLPPHMHHPPPPPHQLHHPHVMGQVPDAMHDDTHIGGPPYGLLMQNSGMMQSHIPGPIPQMPNHLSQPVLSRRSLSPPKHQTIPAVPEPDRVQPQGEPPQHVWASRPQPPKSARRTSSTPNKADNYVGGPPRTDSDQVAASNYRKTQIQHQQQLLEQQQQQLQNQHLQKVQNQRELNAHQEHIHRLNQSQVGVQTDPVPVQKSPQMLRHSVPNTMARQPDMTPTIPQDEAQDVSVTSEFMAQFINDDWNTNDIDLDAQWDLMDALETPI